MTCDLDACKICTRCYHGNHAQCADIVTCPADNRPRVCKCCGTPMAAADEVSAIDGSGF